MESKALALAVVMESKALALARVPKAEALDSKITTFYLGRLKSFRGGR
jgi:hypothetical protein